MLIVPMLTVALQAVCLANAVLDPSRASDAELLAALDLEHPGLETVRDAVREKDYAAAARTWAEYFRARERPTPHYDRAKWADFMRRTYPQLIPPILEMADAVAGGEIAHPPITFKVDGRAIDWLSNPTKDTNYVSVVGSQWFMNPLGRAYLLTGDERYAEAFAWVFESWYDNQDAIRAHQGGLGFEPIYHAYYPGIHTRILADNYYAMAASPSLTPALHAKILKQLLTSCDWLHRDNRSYRPGNQQVGAVVGLGVTGIVFPEFKAAEQWVACAEARMKEHLREDFFPDGAHSELCTQYHKTCLRDMGYLGMTAAANGRPSLFGGSEAQALERAYDWLAKLVMPTGQTPALHSAVFATDWAIHLAIGARCFERPDFRWLAQRFWEQGVAPCQKGPVSLACFLVGEQLDPEATARAPRGPEANSVHLEPSGFAVLRTGWDANDRYLVFQYGWPKSGHAYPAALSFLLAMNGELVATHPGSPRSYRHPAYAYCHSTRAHNLVTIDLADHALQRGIAPGGTLDAYADLPGAWYVSGYHDGYQEACGARHHRSILAIKDGPILIRDRIVGAEGHTAHWNFHTPLETTVGEDCVAMLQGRGTYRLCPARPHEIADVKQDARWMAVLPRDCQPEDCGKVVPVVRYEKPIGPEGVEFCIAIIEGEGGIKALAPQTVAIQTSGGRYVVQYRGDKPSEAAGVMSDAECGCVRFRDGKPDAGWVIEGTRVTVMGEEWLNRQDPVSLALP